MSTYPFSLPNKPKLIGICGLARSGKDTIANYLYENLSPQEDNYILPMALCLKSSMTVAFGIDMYPEDKEEENKFWGVSPRKILQYAGTELFRESMSGLLTNIDSNFWVKRHYGICTGELLTDNGSHSMAYGTEDTIIIPDIRFPEEMEYVIKNGGILIHVIRPSNTGSVGIPGHESEQLEIPYASHIIYNTGTLETLYDQVELLIQSIYIQSN